MIPILYRADEKDFTTQGLGLLSDVQSAKVTEQRNAQYYLNMEMPVFSRLFKEIKLERLVKVDDHNDENQLFRIKKIDTPSNGLCNIYLEHISRDIEGYTINPEIQFMGPANQALEIWKKNLVEKDKVTVFSDITFNSPSKYWMIDEMENPFYYLGGKQGSILQVYNGEYKFDNLNIKLLKTRGVNTGASITYGRNMNDLTQEESIEELANSIYPFAWKDKEDGNQEDREMIVLDPLYVDGPHIDKYAERRVVFVDFTDKAPKDKVALKKLAEKYVKDNNVGAPKVSMTVSPVLNGQIAKGLELEKFEQVNLCDIVTVKYYKLGIDVQAKVNEVTFDVLSQRFSEYKLGDEKRTLASSLGAIESNVNSMGKELQDLSNWSQQSADGKNTIFYGKDEPKANKVGDTWFKDNPDDSTTIHVWDGQTWKEVKTDYTEEFEQLDKELAEQKENIDKSLEQSEQAIKDSNLSIEKAEKAEQDANKAIEEAGFVGKELGSVKETIDYQSNKITELDKTTISNGKQIEEIGTGLKETITKTDENGKQITQIGKDYNGLSTIVTELEKDFDNLELPTRNLVRDSLVESCSKDYLYRTFDMVDKWDDKSEYGFILKGELPEGKQPRFYGMHTNGPMMARLSKIDDNLFYFYGKPESLTNDAPILNVYMYPNDSKEYCIDWIAIYKNDNKTKTWYPALEDNAKTLAKHWTEIEQNSKNIDMQAGQIKDGTEKLAQLEIDSGKIQSSVSELEQRKTGIQNLIYSSRGDSIDGLMSWGKVTIEKVPVFNDIAIRVRTNDDTPIVNAIGFRTNGFFKVKKDKKLQVSFDLAGYCGSVDMSYMFLLYKDGQRHQEFSMDKFESVGTHLERIYGTVTPSRDGEAKLLIGTTKSSVASSKGFYVARWQIVESDIKIADWSPAPEDMSGKMSVVEQTVDGIKQTVKNKADKSEVTQLAGQITSVVKDVEGNKSQITQNKELILQTIEDVDGRFVSTQQSIDGIQQTVKGKADQSQVTQLDNQITQVVKNTELPNLITNSSMINRDYSGWTLGDRWYSSIVTRGGNGSLAIKQDSTSPLSRAINDFLEIRANTVLSFSLESFTESREGGGWYSAIAFYDDSKKYISEVRLSMDNKNLKEWETFVKEGIVVPENSRYTRVAVIAVGGIWAYFGKPLLVQNDTIVTYRPSEVSQSQITQTKDMINLKVSKGDVMSQINVEADKMLFQSKKMVFDAETVLIKGQAWMDGAIIKDASIGTAQIENASITNAKIGSMDVGKLTSGTIKTGNIKIASTLEITDGNGTLNGHYDYREDSAIEKRRFNGSWKLGWRDLQFSGMTYDLTSNYKARTETSFGQDTIKMRSMKSDGESIKQRIDMRVYSRAEIELVEYEKSNDTWAHSTRITPQYVRADSIGAKVIHNNTVSDEQKLDLSKWLHIYPSNPNDPTSSAVGFSIRRNTPDGEAIWGVKSDYIANSRGGGAYEVRMSSANYLRSSKYADNTLTLKASKPLSLARSASAVSMIPNVNGIDMLTPSVWKDGNRPKESTKYRPRMKSASQYNPFNKEYVTGYTVEDLVDAGLTNAVIYDSETGEPNGINLSGLMPYVFENIKLLKKDNKILRRQVSDLREDVESQSKTDSYMDRYQKYDNKYSPATAYGNMSLSQNEQAVYENDESVYQQVAQPLTFKYNLVS